MYNALLGVCLMPFAMGIIAIIIGIGTTLYKIYKE